MPRALPQIAKAAGRWIAEARARYGWTEEDLIDGIHRLFGHFRVVRVPTVEQIQALEAGREQYLPAWVKFARLAVEREELLSAADTVRWAEERSPWQGDVPHDDFDCCWPLVTQPEYHLLEHLDSMPEGDRRMAFRLAAAWQSPYATRNKVFEAVIQALSSRMHVAPTQKVPPATRRMRPDLVQLLYELEGDDVNALQAYLACDQAGRLAIARIALSEVERVMGLPGAAPDL